MIASSSRKKKLIKMVVSFLELPKFGWKFSWLSTHLHLVGNDTIGQDEFYLTNLTNPIFLNLSLLSLS